MSLVLPGPLSRARGVDSVNTVDGDVDCDVDLLLIAWLVLALQFIVVTLIDKLKVRMVIMAGLLRIPVRMLMTSLMDLRALLRKVVMVAEKEADGLIQPVEKMHV